MKIPKEFRINDISINCHFFILLKPIKLIPISSGNGDMIIKAPKIGKIQEK